MSALQVEDQRRGTGFSAHDVLSNPPRRAELTSLVELAARVCQTRMAAIVLVDEGDQQMLASAGFDRPPNVDLLEGISPRDGSAAVVVPDVRLDARFASSQWTRGDLSLVRFYASHALRTKTGNHLGTLVLLDNVAGSLDVSQRASLATIVDRIVDLFELVIRTRELTQMLAEVHKVHTDLERSNERLSWFAGQVSHDLKTPLTSVMLSLSLIQEHLEEGDTGPDLAALLTRAVNGSSRMGALIDDVLEYARVGGTLRSSEVNLGHVLNDVLIDLESKLEGVTIEASRLPTVMGDEDQLRAVMQNLVMNAASFRHPERPPHIEISARHVGRGWRIEVRDNGSGVPADARDRIFEPFTRVDERVEGEGIGLATCRLIIGAHGGAIGLDPSDELDGARFWFELPA